jgi:hypothetical protein
MIRSGLYPQLGQYFRTTEELASAGCMSVRRLYDVLHGRKNFTEDEKRAIWNAILVKENKIEARGDFDERFKRKAG